MRLERLQVGVAMLVLTVLSAAALVACKVRPGCIIADKAATAIGNAISAKAACKKPDVMRQGVLEWCNEDLGLCRSNVQQTGMIADIVCPLIGEFGKAALAQKLSQSHLLQAAECDPSMAASAVVEPIVDACRLLPF